VALSVLLAGCNSEGGSGLPAASAAPDLQVPVAPATSSDASVKPEKGTGVGTTQPRREAKLATRVGGVLVAVAVDEGDRVKRGALLFRLDARQQGLAVQQAKVGVEAAELAVRTAELEFNRTKELHAKRAAPPAALDQGKARLDGAKVGLEQAKVGLAMAQKAVSDTAIRAPFDGVVSERRMDEGETVSMMPPTVVIVLQDIDELDVYAQLPENVLASVRVDQKISVRFPSLDLVVEAKIARVSPAIDSRTRTLEIVARVDNANHKLKPGMMAEVVLDGATVDAGSVVAPSSASAEPLEAKK